MRIKELSQLYYLSSEIDRDTEKINELYSKAMGCASQVDDMPQGAGVTDKVGKFAVEITALREVIEKNVQRRIEERTKLLVYINKIPDSLTREIFKARFEEGLSWERVAGKVGGGNTSASVQQRVFRELKSCQ